MIFVLAEKVTLVKFLHPENASAPITVIFFGIVSFPFSALQFLNAPF